MEIWLSGLDGIKVARALRDKGSRVILSGLEEKAKVRRKEIWKEQEKKKAICFIQ